MIDASAVPSENRPKSPVVIATDICNRNMPCLQCSLGSSTGAFLKQCGCRIASPRAGYAPHRSAVIASAGCNTADLIGSHRQHYALTPTVSDNVRYRIPNDIKTISTGPLGRSELLDLKKSNP
jgi:hypothetical protein